MLDSFAHNPQPTLQNSHHVCLFSSEMKDKLQRDLLHAHTSKNPKTSPFPIRTFLKHLLKDHWKLKQMSYHKIIHKPYTPENFPNTQSHSNLELVTPKTNIFGKQLQNASLFLETRYLKDK